MMTVAAGALILRMRAMLALTVIGSLLAAWLAAGAAIVSAVARTRILRSIGMVGSEL